MSVPDLHTIRAKEEAAMRLVIKLATARAADEFEDDPADPGWQSEMHEDLLRDAVVAYAAAIENRRKAEKGETP